MFKLINFSLKAVIIILVSTLLLIFSAFFYFSSGLPDYKRLSNYQPPISSRVYSKDGKLIAEYALEKRLFVPYDSIPVKVINSFLSAEDKNFFNHPGVDAKGIIRATINNIKRISNKYQHNIKKTITDNITIISNISKEFKKDQTTIKHKSQNKIYQQKYQKKIQKK